MQNIKEDRSFTSLFSDLTREMTDLFQKEVELAKAEFSGKVSAAETGLISLAMGGAVIVAGLLVLLSATVLALAQLMNWDSPWLAALIVGVVVTVVGIILLQQGRKKIRAQSLVPRRTAAALRKDKDLVKENVNEITGRQAQF